MLNSRVYLTCLIAALSLATASGRVVTPPPLLPRQGAEIESVELRAVVRKQVAEVSYTVELHNPTPRTIESEYLFPLPAHGTLQDVVLLADGKELPGRILPKDEARRIYESIVRSRRDPALIEYIGRGLYRASVFPIPPGESRAVTLKTTYLCPLDDGMAEFSFPLAPHGHGARGIKRLEIIVDIHADEPLKSVYSPSHGVSVERLGNNRARAVHSDKNLTPKRDFRLFFGTGEGLIGGTVISHRPRQDQDGYFLLLASPEASDNREEKDERGKTVVFAIDRSGSMRGRKMEQARNAAKFVISNLNAGDLFNIVVYDGNIETFRPELERVTPETRQEALGYIANLRAGGMTDIDGAMQTSLEMLAPDGGPAYVLFMTDGMPTAGERNESKIVRNAAARNSAGARIFSFGVGYDVNARLLDRISGANGGYTEYVRPDEDVEASVARFYSRVTSPVMSGIGMKVSPVPVNRVYPGVIPDIFEGGQVVLAGRYSGSGPAVFTLEGAAGGERRSMSIEAELAGAGGAHAGRFEFVERIWAQRRVGAILQKIDLHGQEDELVGELLDLSRKYGILTPYTSFLADEDAERGEGARELSRERTVAGLAALREPSGRSGVEQRAQMGRFFRSESLMDENIAADTEGRTRRVDTVSRAAGLTFFRRGDEWVQAELLDEDLDGAGLEEVERYSGRFFELASETGEGRALAMEGTVVARLGGRVYRISDPPGE